MRRRGLGVAMAVVASLLVAGCVAGSGEYLDGHQVEGVWVANESSPCPLKERCDAAIAVAKSVLLAREPSAKIESVSFHWPPSKRSDGQFVAHSFPTYEFVLTLADGSERVEWFGCAIGGAFGESPEAFAAFCPKPDTGPPSTTLVDLTGMGAMSWTHHLDAGRYGFGWWTTANADACDARLMLEGPSRPTELGRRHLEPYMSWGSGDVSVRPSPSPSPSASAGAAILVDVTTASQAPASAGTVLSAGTYTVRLATDCPGESHLWVSRYDGS